MLKMVMNSHYENRNQDDAMCDAIDSVMATAVERGNMRKWIVGSRAVLRSKSVTFIVDAIECTKSTFSKIIQ